MYAQVPHQRSLRLRIQGIERYLAFTHFGQKSVFHGHGHTVFIVGKGHVVGTTLHRIRGIPHGNTQISQLQHGHIGHAVTEHHNLVRLDALHFHDDAQRIGFVHSAAHHFQKIRFGTEHIQYTVQTTLPMILQPYQSLLIITHQHTFARRVIYRRREKLLMFHFHTVQSRLGLHMRIIRVIRHDRISVISKD